MPAQAGIQEAVQTITNHSYRWRAEDVVCRWRRCRAADGQG